MVHKLLDRTSESTSATGAGNFEFAGAEQNAFAFAAGLADGDTTDYYATGAAGEFEFGKLTYESTGDEGIRTEVHGGSNGTSPVSFTQAPKVTACVGATSLKGQWVQIGDPVVASGAATVEFDLPPGHRRYRVEFFGVVPSADANLIIRTSSNGGSSFDAGASDYSYEGWHHNATTITPLNDSANDFVPLSLNLTVESSPPFLAAGHIEIIDPASASPCHIWTEIKFQRSSVGRYHGAIRGLREASADVDAIQITAVGQNISGTFVLLVRR